MTTSPSSFAPNDHGESPLQSPPADAGPEADEAWAAYLETTSGAGRSGTQLRSLVEVLNDMITHEVNNPTHGTGCACKDSLVSEARRILRESIIDADSAIVSRNTSLLFHHLYLWI